MNKGEDNLSEEEMDELRVMVPTAQAYEKAIYTIPAPPTQE